MYSALDMAFDNKLYNFTQQGKVQKIGTQIYRANIFLQQDNSFEETEWELWYTFKHVVLNPRQFYLQAFGKYFIEIGSYIGFILLFTYIIALQRPALYDDMSIPEKIFWYLSLGYIGYEIYEIFYETGVSQYLLQWSNYIDLTICINLIAVFVIKANFVLKINFNKCDIDNDDGRFADYNYNTGYKLPSHAVCPTSVQICM